MKNAERHTTKNYQYFFQSGGYKTLSIDYKGNTLQTSQQLAQAYKTIVDWSALAGLTNITAIDAAAAGLLETETFSNALVYDALDRPTQITLPDATEVSLVYNEAGLLDAIDAKIRGAASSTNFVSNINYNEKGQREKIVYGNGAQTAYTYDINNFRLVRLLSTRNSGADILQDLNYTHDPIGNIVEITDAAQQTHFFQNAVVSPSSKYTYDALYRLLSGTGREHAGAGQTSESDYPINTPIPQNNNSGAVVNYTQQFSYDGLGNILKLIHQAAGNNWTRDYFYESGKNYLKGHSSGATEYTYDAQGNMTSMPHLANMQWDIFDNLKEVDLGGGGTAWYVYNSQGVRIRKVIENGANKTERIYLGESNEVYREYLSGSLKKERETLHISDDTGRIALTETLTIDNGSPIGSPTPIIKYQLNNLLGSACLELDISANILTYEEYHPFGTSSYRLGTSSAEVSLKRYRYVGKERDDETGLYYYGARYYAAWLCRFTATDPKEFQYFWQSTYVYAANHPINLIDVNGEGPGGGDPDYFGYAETSPSGEQVHVIKFDYEAGVTGKYNYNYDGRLESFTFTNWPSPSGELTFTWNDALGEYFSTTEGLTYSDFVYEFRDRAEGEHWQYSIIKATYGAGDFVLSGISDPVKTWEALNDPNNIVYTKDVTYTDILVMIAPIVWAKYKSRYAGRIADYKSKVSNKGGAVRSALYSSEWGSASLSEIINRFAPDGDGFKTPTGKTVYKNNKTGIQVVYDEQGNYFRIENTNLSGRRRYLDLQGNIPNNKVVDGKTTGRSQVEYNQVTHFNNLD